MNDKLTEDFLNALVEVEQRLLMISYVKHSFQQKGSAYFVEFKSDNILIEFLFGPPEFQIEMIVYRQTGNLLLEIY